MEVEDHFLGGWVAEPVRFRAVRERDIFWGEALLFGECWIKIIKIGAEISILIISAVCPSWIDCAIWGGTLTGDAERSCVSLGSSSSQGGHGFCISQIQTFP